MLVYSEISLMEFNAWCGAVETKKKIIESNKVDEFNELIEECYPFGISSTTLNDILWFNDEWIFESLGIEIEE